MTFPQKTIMHNRCCEPLGAFVDLGGICGVPTLASRKHGCEGHGIGWISLIHLMAYWLEHSCRLNIKHMVT